MSLSDPFYAPEYFEFMEQILDFESQDPATHQRGADALTQLAAQGNTGAMTVLGRHYLQGAYRDADQALHWYTQALRHGEKLSYSTLARLYAHPDGEDMEQAVARMEAQGVTRQELQKLYYAGLCEEP